MRASDVDGGPSAPELSRVLAAVGHLRKWRGKKGGLKETLTLGAGWKLYP